ncbi:hypothetical protein BAUCODRAFT_126519 [Baudoinia panamericana UAMH 10762]|uniref:Uncharacterized protein n=1 Tax=Baudoinia panamericana (strain UAMH 10762) TaxID=717646 RepID=M2N0X6_BAUPA|nr:uncharacterized protein BAUCODRAFT_126519 [Baudoinia panamericana UAMH 10762]EMC92554.1 hypothetical protein BAUCODRAFT_126519 [Baudoinia panamericana UAMH 10762]
MAMNANSIVEYKCSAWIWDLLSTTETDDIKAFLQTATKRINLDRTQLSRGLPLAARRSITLLVALSTLLPAIPGQWPVLQLQLAYSRAYDLLPEDIKAGRGGDGARRFVARVTEQCGKRSYT